MSLYQQEAQRIIALLKRDFTLPSGALCLKRNQKRSYKSPHHIFPDLGDYIPFFLYFGEERFVDHQITVLNDTLQRGILVSEFPAFNVRGFAKSYEYSDFLLGLLDYHLHCKTQESRDLLKQHVDQAIRIFHFDTAIDSFYYPRLKFGVPIVDSRDGMMIEVFLDVYELLNDQKLHDTAVAIYQQLIASSFYRQHHIFPTFSSRGLLDTVLRRNQSSVFNQGKLGKCNTNTLFALLKLYQVSGDSEVRKVLIQTTEALQEKTTVPGGGVVSIFKPGNFQKERACLTPSFAMLDFLCDFYYTERDPGILAFARSIADFWLSRQAATGLFPHFDGGEVTFFDSETDMTVALYKLYEITGDNQYRAAADDCLQGILNYHGRHDYVNGVNVQTGAVTDYDQKSKFLSLFLKLLILIIEYNAGATIYGKPELFNLLKDR